MKLEIELVPSSCWFNNVRSAVSAQQWNLIKSQVASQAYNICEICEGVGPQHPVECHEIFSYNEETLTQKLEKIVALCPDCHSAKHFGLAKIRGKDDYILKHLMKINNITKAAANDYIKDVFQKWSERSKKTWKLDLSHLTEYGINVEKIKKDKKT